MKDHSGSFSYEDCPLPRGATHIRLLELHPSKPTDATGSAKSHFSSTLVCDLIITPLLNPKPFKALSYTWGTQDKTSVLDVAQSSLSVTPSLDVALRHLRSRHETITLWVDQICIDQGNAAEKADQVLAMKDIYTSAERVLVWLGPEADRSDELMDLFQQIGQRALDIGVENYYTREKVALLHAIMDDPSVDDPITQPYHELMGMAWPLFEDLLHAIVAWDKRPWFYRVWVVQEVSLCPDTAFACGYKVVPVELVRLAEGIFNSAMKQPLRQTTDRELRELALEAQDSHRIPLLSTRRRRQKFLRGLGPGDELFRLLKQMFVEGDTNATNNRDRIYGLLGLAIDAEQLGIQPDYASEDASPIFTSAARAMIQNGRVDLLSFSQFPKEAGLENLPTWVPDWRPMLERSFYTIFENAEDHLLAASGDTGVCVVPHQDPRIIGLRGYEVDTIEEVGDIWKPSDGSSYCTLLQSIGGLCAKSFAKGEPIYKSLERQREAIWRVPIGDIYWRAETDYLRAGHPQAVNDYHDCMKIMETLELWEGFDPEEKKKRSEGMTAWRDGAGNYRNNMSVMTGKRPYLTRRGYLGMCPGLTVTGDVVVIFNGARIPYVLRQRDDSEEFRFVGEAYCDGMMDGEILERAKERDFFIG